jgi:hypothetical protein
MATKEDEARANRIRAVINALNGRGSNSPGVQQEHLPAALVAFFVDELREQVKEVVELIKTQPDDEPPGA